MDRISFGRVVMTFEDGSEIIMPASDPEFLDCRFRLLEADNTAGHTGRPRCPR